MSPASLSPVFPPLRSVLFAPGNNAEMLAKLPRSKPDAVVIDLEDAVPVSQKERAREVARRMGSELVAAHPEIGVFVRLNPVGSPWFEGDIAQGLSPEVAGVLLPKFDRSEQGCALDEALARHGLVHLRRILGIETVAGVARVDEILDSEALAVYFGAEDFTTDLGGERTVEGMEVLYARSRVAIAARLAGVPALDQVVVNFRDDARFRREAAQARALGYAGKLCIHPAQVPLANEAFSPGPEEVERATRILAAVDRAASEGRGAIEVDGEMIDEPLAARARAVLARAGQSERRDPDE